MGELDWAKELRVYKIPRYLYDLFATREVSNAVLLSTWPPYPPMIPFLFLFAAFCPLYLMNRPYSFLSRVLSRVSNGEDSVLKEWPMKARRDPRRRIFHVRLRGEKTPETWTHVPQRAEP